MDAQIGVVRILYIQNVNVGTIKATSYIVILSMLDVPKWVSSEAVKRQLYETDEIMRAITFTTNND